MAEDLPPTLLSRLVRWVLLWFYKARGWKAAGTPPADRRCVIIAAPHTSNWDFVNLLGLAGDLGIKVHFMGKRSLWRWPLKRFMTDMGGLPVDRSTSSNAVAAMIEEFRRRKQFMLVIAPEGTRGKVGKWRTGFYHIARGAGVPLVVGMMDYGRRTGGLGETIWPSGDYKADMRLVAEAYRSVTARHPERGIKDFDALIAEGENG